MSYRLAHPVIRTRRPRTRKPAYERLVIDSLRRERLLLLHTKKQVFLWMDAFCCAVISEMKPNKTTFILLMLFELLVWGCGRQEAIRNEVLGYSPLTAAVVDGDVETAIKLIQNGADTNVRDAMDMTPLHHAVSYNSAAMVDLLLSNEADVYLKDEVGQTAMRLALELAKLPKFDDQIISALREHEATKSGSVP